MATYIQSGNVLFTAGRASERVLTRRIEEALSATFVYQFRVVVRSFEQMKEIVREESIASLPATGCRIRPG